MSEGPDAIRSAYHAAPGFEAELVAWLDLQGVRQAGWHGALLLSPDPPVDHPWSMNTWLEPREIRFGSIAEGAAALRAIQRSWAPTGTLHRGRMALIAERLPGLRRRPLRFPEALPEQPLGAFTLLEPGLMLASASCTARLPDGAVAFEEDREGPPSRAYLKLWEALTLAGTWPSPGDRVVDLGAAPGGWTWALAGLGARVIAVDKAPLDPSVAAMPGVEVRRESAFGLDPRRLKEELGSPVDWLFSDVVCYPERLLGLVRTWLDSGATRRVLCTIKFQGGTDHAVAAEFARIPGARLRHLFHNRHELTLLLLPVARAG